MDIAVRSGKLKIGSMFIMIGYWDKGKFLYDSLNVSFRSNCFIDKNNLIRFYQNNDFSSDVLTLVLDSDKEKSEFRELNSKFNDKVLDVIRHGIKQILSGLKVIEIDNNTFEYDPQIKISHRKLNISQRNSNITLIGIENFEIWSPTKELVFDENLDYSHISDEKLMPVYQSKKSEHQLELSFN